jgi:hypothetical protein
MLENCAFRIKHRINMFIVLISFSVEGTCLYMQLKAVPLICNAGPLVMFWSKSSIDIRSGRGQHNWYSFICSLKFMFKQLWT